MKQIEALNQFESAVYKYARQWITYPSIAQEYELEDLAQIGRMYVLRAVEEFDPEAGMKFSTYVIQRIRWGLNTSLRSSMPKAKRETKHFSIDAMNEDKRDRWHPYTDGRSDTFEDMVSGLSPQYRQILTLRFIQEATLKEIGQVFGYTHEWARLTIEKAINKLKD